MRSWCFDSQATTVNGETTYDREYGSTEIREVIGKLIGNGVYANPATNMQVVADSGLNIKVQPGCCWVKGAFGVADTEESLTLEASAGGRVDLIVARFDLSLSYRSIRLTVVKGTEGSATVPALTRNNSIYDIQLAKINVRAGTASVLQSDITDTRYDATVCGIVTGVINQIDSTNLFAQYKAAFDAFMASLEYTLTGDAAGNLLTLINQHKTNDTVHVTASDRTNWNSKANGSHNHTPAQVGLGNVDNIRQYSVNNKPSKSDVGLGNVANERQYSANNPPPKSVEIKTITAAAHLPNNAVFSFAPAAIIASTHHETAKAVLLPKGATDPANRALFDNIEISWSDNNSVNIINSTQYAQQVTVIALR